VTIPSEIKVVEIRYVNASDNKTIKVEHHPYISPAINYSHPLSPHRLNTTHNNYTLNSSSIHSDEVFHANHTIYYPKNNFHDPNVVKAITTHNTY
jgi:hypothetical protein